MNGWHLGEMLAFDTETTGVNVETDRIVTACCARLWGSGALAADVNNWLVNPGVEIPQGAIDVHGVTNEKAATGRPPAEAIPEIAAMLELAWRNDVPVIGHNVAYDLTILDREMRRHYGETLNVCGPVVDTLVLDKAVDKWRKGKRTLVAAAEHYEVRLDGAHDSSEDALASARIAWRICQRYPQIASMSLGELHQAQVSWAYEQAESFRGYLKRQGKAHDDVDGTWPLRAARTEAVA